ncbi:MAG: hypothetical protein JWQ32_606 [Marmoricola sp.]|nr:hypothetical protein [Marmoricola sp.]
MPEHSLQRRILAVASTVVLICWGSTDLAYAGNHHHKSHGTSHVAPGQTRHDTGHTHGHGGGNTGARGRANAPGQTKVDVGVAAGAGDPPGNNGTIKITPLGEQDGTPNNNPHVTCGFQIEWYGFDQGNYYSQVSFAMQAPTKDATITPNGPTSVFIGGDPASGAGTASGLDARADYYPSFTGTPHPKQGFHVKVTVATPFSQGNDTKSKVFWVQPCTAGTPGTPTGTPTVAPPNAQPPTVHTHGTSVNAVSAPAAGIPTVVEAGQRGPSVLDRVRSPLPLLMTGGLLVALALWSRRRHHAGD